MLHDSPIVADRTAHGICHLAIEALTDENAELLATIEYLEVARHSLVAWLQAALDVIARQQAANAAQHATICRLRAAGRSQVAEPGHVTRTTITSRAA